MIEDVSNDSHRFNSLFTSLCTFYNNMIHSQNVYSVVTEKVIEMGEVMIGQRIEGNN